MNIPCDGVVDDLEVTPEPFPSGDSPIGKVWSYYPPAGKMRLEHPRITFGPSALDNMSGPITLVGNQWNLLASPIPSDGIGMRWGMAAYIPSGWWGITTGKVVIASAVPQCRYDVKVTQGRNHAPGSQPNILAHNTVDVGGGCGTSPNMPWGIFTVPFDAPKIQNECQRDQAGEILVWVFPHTDAAVAGGAMNYAQPGIYGGGVSPGFLSSFCIMRWNGFR